MGVGVGVGVCACVCVCTCVRVCVCVCVSFLNLYDPSAVLMRVKIATPTIQIPV